MVLLWLGAVALIILDLFTPFRFTAKYPVAFVLVFAPHFIFMQEVTEGGYYGIYLLLSVYTLLRINIYPIGRHRTASHRLNFMYSGKRMLNLSLYLSLVQLIFYPVVLHYISLSFKRLVADIIITLVIICLTALNGMLRVIFTSKWLNVLKRLVCFMFVLVPGINVIVMLYLMHIASKEYDYFEYKLNDMPSQIENQVCRTRYPILLVHGVGFRDARYFNYWGRIPKYLRVRGAEIFYGNQEGWATIDSNAELLHSRVMEILKQTGAEKINIIAHSKGGLDCRKMIHKYNMDRYVASLTTMGTPHYGVRFADVLLKRIPDSFVNRVADIFNNIFRKYGDTRPDFKRAVYMLTEKYAMEFNAEVKDSPNVYYQSYSSVMNSMFSDPILTVPYLIGRAVGTRYNDGLVPEPSAHWGNFRGMITSKGIHGVSHGDLIDLKREDFRGFDMLDKYVEIVSELKKMGY